MPPLDDVAQHALLHKKLRNEDREGERAGVVGWLRSVMHAKSKSWGVVRVHVLLLGRGRGCVLVLVGRQNCRIPGRGGGITLPRQGGGSVR
jgi:hypothetical protein